MSENPKDRATVVNPVMFWDEPDPTEKDFRPKISEPEDEEVETPKDSSAQEPVDSQGPGTEEETPLFEPSEKNVPVTADNGKDNQSESFTPASSSKTSPGKSKQPASE